MEKHEHRHLDHILNARNLNILTAFLVVLILIGAFIYSVHVIWMALVALFTAALVEYLFARFRKKKFELLGIAVTPFMLVAMLPPALPLWMVVVGAFFAVFFGKMIFGGLGKNIFNPALVGYLYLQISFPLQMTAQWLQPGSDLFASPTLLRVRDLAFSNETVMGFLLGDNAQSVGNTLQIAVLILGLLLIALKISDWRLPVSFGVSMIVLTWVFGLLYPGQFHHPLLSLFVGGAMFAMFFVITDPVSAPFSNLGKVVYGFGIALITVIIRGLAAFPEGIVFAVIIMNAVAPMIDSMKWVQPKEAKV
jgi:Na+-translocating ferredoxin:NAD+ oxidoreductase RnfD subunit